MCDLMQCHSVYSAGSAQRSQCPECPKMFQFNLLKNKESECNLALFVTTSSGNSCRSHTVLEAALMGTSLLLFLRFSVLRFPPWRVHLFSHPIWQQEGQPSQRLPPPRAQCPHSPSSCWAHLIDQFKALEP